MLKKLFFAVILVAVAYVGASYYVGHRAQQQLTAIMNDAQVRANNSLAWEEVKLDHGIFTSTGSMVLVAEQLRIDTQDPNATPIKTRIDYTIRHHLHWARLAQFLWSVTPTEDLAKKLEPFYPQPPSLTGDGMLDWSGVATTSIGFPGIQKAKVNNSELNVAPLTGSMTAGKNHFNMRAGVADITLTEPGSSGRMQLKDLVYEVQSDDVRSGAASATFWLADALLIGADGVANTLSGYRWHFNVFYQNDILSFDTKKTIASMTALGTQVTNVDVSLGIEGLHRSDLQEMAALVDEIDGQWITLSEAQQARAAQIGLSLLARGFTVRAPAIKADIKFLGDHVAQTVGIENFEFSAQVADPALGIGKLNVSLGALKVPVLLQILVPQVTDFEFEVQNTLVDGRTDLYVSKSLAALEQGDQSVRGVEIKARLKGLSPAGLIRVVDMLRETEGDLSNLSTEQQASLVQILQEAASHGLAFELPVAMATVDTEASQPDLLAIEGLDLQIKLDDVSTGAGKASFKLKQLFANGPQMRDVPTVSNYMLTVNNEVIDGMADYQLEQSIDALDSTVVKLGPSVLSVRLTGLSATDLQRLSELAPEFESGLSQAETAALAQIARRAVASGFALSIPKLQLAIDSATVNGQGEVSLVGLGQAPLASFNIARLAQMQAELSVTGQSALLDPWVQQGLMMGLLAGQSNAAQGQYQFKDSQLQLNGMVVPTDEFLLMANLLVQQRLAQHLNQDRGTPDKESGAATRHRRGLNR